jgi:hypothetical protein
MDSMTPNAASIYFKDKAPKGWRPRSYVQKLVNQALDEDSTHKEEVNRWKSKDDKMEKNDD